MSRWKLAGCLVVGAALALGVVVPGSANGARANRIRFGYVDLALITEKIRNTAEWLANMRAFENARTRYRDEIENLVKLRFLSPAEMEELKNLHARPMATEAERKRIAQLETKSSLLEEEYQRLAMTETPTAADRKRLKELTALREASSATIQKEYELRAQELQELEKEMSDRIQVRILEVVRQVARKHGMVLAVDRQAVLNGGVDLTQKVLREVDLTQEVLRELDRITGGSRHQ